MNMHYELAITGGSQVGAKATLHRKGKTIVGTDLGCDIVLGGGSDQCQAELQNDARNGWSFTLLDGNASYENTPCIISKPVTVTLGKPITVGSATLVIQSLDRIDIPPLDISHDSVPGTELNNQDIVNQTFWHNKLLHTPRPFLLLGLIGIVLAGTGLATVSGSFSEQLPEETTPSIRSLLDGAGFSQLEYMENDSGGGVITGFLHSWSDRIAVWQLLSDRDTQVQIKTVIGKNLEDSVIGVYRIHGVSATAEATDIHNITVRTNEASQEKLKRAEAAVRSDIPELILSPINTPPPPKVVAARDVDKADKYYVEDPGKKVIAIVVGDPSYVVTQDQSRYYVGSVLSSGHRIKSIDEDLVQLDKAGVITTLRI